MGREVILIIKGKTLNLMLRIVKGVKSENPKGEGEFRKWEGGDFNYKR